MSEVAELSVEQQDGQPSAGTLLRRAREAAGVNIATVAVALKVPVRKLEALEEDRWQELGDPVFVRGLASSVCRTLKADPQPILERLPHTSTPRLVKDREGLNAPFRAPGDGPAPTLVTRLRQPVPAAVVALLLAAVAVYFLPTAAREERGASSAKPAAVPRVAMASPIAAPEVAPSPGSAASGPALHPAALATEPARAGADPVAAAAAPTAPDAAAPASHGLVMVRARGESWVEVVDAKGATPLRKLMAAGESAGAGGALPLTVTVGNAAATDVDVRGQRFDLRPVSHDNVAHFQVK